MRVWHAMESEHRETDEEKTKDRFLSPLKEEEDEEPHNRHQFRKRTRLRAGPLALRHLMRLCVLYHLLPGRPSGRQTFLGREVGLTAGTPLFTRNGLLPQRFQRSFLDLPLSHSEGFSSEAESRKKFTQKTQERSEYQSFHPFSWICVVASVSFCAVSAEASVDSLNRMQTDLFP